MTDPLTYLAAALDAAQRDAEYSRDEFMFFDTGDERVADHYQRAGSPEAVLRRIAADRKQYAEHLPIPDHGRFSNRYGEDCPDWCEGVCHDQPKVCRSCRDYAGDPIEAPCRTVEIMAQGWGWTEETP